MQPTDFFKTCVDSFGYISYYDVSKQKINEAKLANTCLFLKKTLFISAFGSCIFKHSVNQWAAQHDFIYWLYWQITQKYSEQISAGNLWKTLIFTLEWSHLRTAANKFLIFYWQVFQNDGIVKVWIIFTKFPNTIYMFNSTYLFRRMN